MSDILAVARSYALSGLSVIPILADGSKAPALREGERDPFTRTIADDKQLTKWFPRCAGVGILGGQVSGGLEILDFDKPGIFDQWLECVSDLDPALFITADSLPHVSTPALGDHLFYRCSEIAGSQKLARAKEKFIDCTGKEKDVLIETRGEGGYVVAPGSSATCHKANRTYDFVNGSDLSAVPTITPEERAMFLQVARALNEIAKPVTGADKKTDGPTGAGRPGDDFNDRGPSWAEILEPHGWQRVCDREGCARWRRPGKKDGISATTGKCGDKLYVFSSNADPFESERAYDKFAAFTFLNHHGDFREATRDLGGQGFGRQSAEERRPRQSEQPQPQPDADPQPEDTSEPRLKVVSGPGYVRVRDVVPDAPVTESHVVPERWDMRDSTDRGYAISFWKKDKKGDGYKAPIIQDPVVIEAWLSNQTTDKKWVRVAWKAGKWHRREVPFDRLMHSAKIVEALTGSGFPASSNNSHDVVAWFEAYWNANRWAIPSEQISEQMGWQGDHRTDFLLGNRAFGDSVHFAPADAGDKQIADALCSAGTFDAWAASVAWLTEYPNVQIALYASLAAPLLELLDVPNFIIDWSYRTSSGKSTALQVAASVWGHHRVGSFIGSWLSSPVGIERRAAVLNGLPFILDDTKDAAKVAGQSIVPGIVYFVASGTGKGRGSVAGMRANPSFHTVMLTSGEMRIVDFSRDGGTAARAISLWGHPFGNHDVGDQMRQMDLSFTNNFGLAGPIFVEFLRKNREFVPEWRRQMYEIAEGMRKDAKNSVQSEVAGRIAKPLALLVLAGRLAHQAMPFPWEFGNPVNTVFGQLIESAKDADRASEAAIFSRDWAVQHIDRFQSSLRPVPLNEESEKTVERVPQGGWLGRWDVDTKIDDDRWEAIHFLPDALIAELTRAGFDAKACVRIWADRDWLMHDVDKKTRCHQRVGGQSVLSVSLKKCAFSDHREQGNEQKT